MRASPVLFILIVLQTLTAPAQDKAGSRCEVRFEKSNQTVRASLRDRLRGELWSDAPYQYAVLTEEGSWHSDLRDTSIRRTQRTLRVRGSMVNGALRVTQTLSFPRDAEYFEERIQLANYGKTPLHIKDVNFGFQRVLDHSADSFRWVAVPFRRQADGKLHDYSTEDLRQGRFSNSDWKNEAAVAGQDLCDQDRLRADAWIWTDGRCGLLVAKYNSERIEHSVARVQPAAPEKLFCFGGAGLSLYREPRAATVIQPGQQLDFGVTRYTCFDGGWERGYELYRSFLDAHGHCFPRDYNPPLNWNELFDVGWYHSDRAQLLQHYTQEALFGEAAKARDLGCDLLYLDPGWEICEGTTLWDKERLGPVSLFASELKKRYGLGLGYRTIGRVYRDEFPHAWYLRRENREGDYARPVNAVEPAPEPVPLTDAAGRRNLALLPGARASASSLIQGFPEKHTVEHLNDGYYNNGASWIPATEPSWVAIDLGSAYAINEVAIGSEHTATFRDRMITAMEFKVTSVPSPAEKDWKQVLEYRGTPISSTRHFHFETVQARHVRLTILNSQGGAPRIDELEIYEAQPDSRGEQPVRRLAPKNSAGPQINFWEVCTQSRAWQKEKLKRILDVTGGGVSFMMFDEFDWRGPCFDPGHGHAVPSTPEGHVQAVYGLVESMRRKYPAVLVEAHDPVWPWGTRYLPTYFRQGFQGNRYQENWGFEFMWNPIDDLKSGRALCLYYYNLGCNVPLYDHITMEADNDACLSFWWYASTVRHLGIGGKKGLNSAAENEPRFQAYKRAVAQYNRLRACFAAGEFVGLGETAHLHLHPERPLAVLNLFNLTDTAQTREVRITARQLHLNSLSNVSVTGSPWRVENNTLLISAQLPPLTPAVVEIRREGSSRRP